MVEQLGELLRNNMSEGPFKDLLIDGIIGGVGAVIVFFTEYPDSVFLYFYHGGFWLYGSCGFYHG